MPITMPNADRMKWRGLRRVFAITIRARLFDGHHAGPASCRCERFVGGLDDHAVAHRDHALRDARHSPLVGHDHQRHAVLGVELAEEVDDLLAGLGVEVAGRLVAQQQRRRAEQRARDRDALLLPARQLARPTVREVCEADPPQRLARRARSTSFFELWANAAGIVTLPRHVRWSIRLNAWNTNPIDWLRSLARLASPAASVSTPSTSTSPASG